MTYGSATTAEGVREFMQSVRGGKASEEVIAEFERRYGLIGRSPLIDITREQARLLEEKLGADYVVRAGMRHGAPSIANAVAACRDKGATKLIGLILSPQLASFITDSYTKAFNEAANKSGYSEDEVRLIGPWPDEPHFIELLASRTRDALLALPTNTPVVFTTHSLPERVVAGDPEYLSQLKRTIDAVRAKLGSSLKWYAAYQSAGHTPEAWLKPDLTDILDEIKHGGAKSVLIVPIQFLSDHLEVLYDLDIAAREQCEGRGIKYGRIELPNTNSLFIETLAGVI